MSSYSPELGGKDSKFIRFSRMGCKEFLNISFLLSCVLSGLIGLAYLCFDPLVRSIILNKLTLSNTSETFYIWEDPPISPHLKVYFLNLTNPEEFFQGSGKPVLQEIGPYTYRQKWIKQNISWNPNGTISYRTRKIFSFSSSESCEGCSDKLDSITTVNVPAISAYHQLRDSVFSGFLLEGMIYGLDYKPWSVKSPDEFLWGHKEPLFDIAKHTMHPPPFDQFGFFVTKNSSKEEDLGLYEMYTGEGDPYKLATIAAFNGDTRLGRWNDSLCDKVHGSDGASFNPYILERDTLWFFNDQLCRAMPLVFNKSVVHKGLPGLRFQPRKDVFMSPATHPENSCFAGEGKVTGNGVFDITSCQFNSPIVLSWPHFLHADSQFSDAVEGLSPEPEKHGFWFDIQPITGTTLSAKARIQINVHIRASSQFSDLEKVNDTVLPVLWFEEGIDELGDEIVAVLKTAAVDPLDYRRYILYIFGVSLAAVLLLGCGAGVRFCLYQGVDLPHNVRDTVQDIWGVGMDRDREGVEQPMLGGYYHDSTDSSRVTTACHSRNCSEGTKPQYVNHKVMEPVMIGGHATALPQLSFKGVVLPSIITVEVPDTLLANEEEMDEEGDDMDYDDEEEEDGEEGEDGEVGDTEEEVEEGSGSCSGRSEGEIV